MAFEEKLTNFIKQYEEMEKKIAQDDPFSKEFTVSFIQVYLMTGLDHAYHRCSSLVRYSGRMRDSILQTLEAYPLTVKRIDSKIFYLVSH